MFAFNNEVIARAILASRLPVVTALGHTSDRTVADMVADAECRTPTEAGARVVPKKSDLLAQLRERGRRLDREQSCVSNARRSGCARGASGWCRRCRRCFARAPSAWLGRARRWRDSARCSRSLAAPSRCASADGASMPWRSRGVDRSVNLLASRRAAERLDRALAARFSSADRGLEHRRERLIALSPDSVLARGYSITQDADSGAVVTAGERRSKRRARSHQPGRGPAGRARRRGRAVSQDLTYEQALAKLDEKLKLLEDGDLSLEDALKAVDEARVYLKICTERLEAARKKIEVRPEE